MLKQLIPLNTVIQAEVNNGSKQLVTVVSRWTQVMLISSHLVVDGAVLRTEVAVEYSCTMVINRKIF